MFCKNCGAQTNNNVNFCDACGTNTGNGAVNPPPAGVGRVGYSPVVNTPEFRKHIGKKKRKILVAVIPVAAIVIFICGALAEEIGGSPAGFIIGASLGLAAAIALCVYIIMTVGRGAKPVDGIVTRKKVEVTRGSAGDSAAVSYDTYFKGADGKERCFGTGNEAAGAYYQVGGAVRYHEDFLFLEKYDKSRDSFVLCAICHTTADIHLDRCPKCKAPLLK